MKPQLPAEGIVLDNDFGDCKFYTVPCTCGSDDHSIKFCMEVSDDGFDSVVVTTWTQQTTEFWKDPFKQNESFQLKNKSWLWFVVNYYLRGWLNSLSHRLACTYKIWTGGTIKYSSTTIMSKQQAINYAATIHKVIHDMDGEKTFVTK